MLLTNSCQTYNNNDKQNNVIIIEKNKFKTKNTRRGCPLGARKTDIVKRNLSKMDSSFTANFSREDPLAFGN